MLGATHGTHLGDRETGGDNEQDHERRERRAQRRRAFAPERPHDPHRTAERVQTGAECDPLVQRQAAEDGQDRRHDRHGAGLHRFVLAPCAREFEIRAHQRIPW